MIMPPDAACGHWRHRSQRGFGVAPRRATRSRAALPRVRRPRFRLLPFRTNQNHPEARNATLLEGCGTRTRAAFRRRRCCAILSAKDRMRLAPHRVSAADCNPVARLPAALGGAISGVRRSTGRSV